MSHNTMSLSEMEMEALIKYGESLTQFDNNEERTECFLKGWRGAFEDPADRARWTQMFPLSAMNALWYRGYLGFAQDTYDQEHRLLFDEIMKLVLDSGADVPAELREAWAKAKRQWGGYYYPTNNLPPAYFTGLYATPSPSPERLVAEAVKEKKKAGRPPGSKDSGPRAPKYTYSNISGAERQRIYRKQRKALLKQQQQQQQQTPPSE